MQVQALNRATLLSWLEGKGRYTREGILLSVPGSGARVALVGDWVIKTYTGEVFSLPDEFFRCLYTTRKLKRKI